MRPGTTPRPTIAMVREAAVTPAWVIAGVYGWLAREALPRATALIWRNIELEECVANITRRGLRRGGDEVSFVALLASVREYRLPRQRALVQAADQDPAARSLSMVARTWPARRCTRE
jgi:hypothetical protein